MGTEKKKSHESIKGRQREVSLPYSDANPSEITDVYWIYAKKEKGEYPKSTKRNGKWLLFEVTLRCQVVQDSLCFLRPA